MSDRREFVRSEYMTVALLLAANHNKAFATVGRPFVFDEFVGAFSTALIAKHATRQDYVDFITFCSRHRIVEVFKTPHALDRVTYNITAGMNHYNKLVQIEGSAYYYSKKLGYEWLIESLDNLGKPTINASIGAQAASQDQTYADDDVWEPLPIDRSNPDYDNALSSAEAALKEIEGNNGYAATEPLERNGIVAAIRGSIQSIREGMPSLKQVYASLLAPLKYIAKKFGDAAMGEAAKQAVVAIGKWLLGLVT